MKRNSGGFALALWFAGGVLEGQVVLKQQGYVPFSDAPIYYRSEKLDDPIARLQRRLDAGELTLKYDAEHGYLRTVLDTLHVPISSQTLVFSKTSFQYPHISPEKPRALYFNDDIYIGQVHNARALEFVSFDPVQGAIFYIMDEQNSGHPRFERAENDCIQCHVAASTRGVPGVLVRSIFTRASGLQAGGTPAFVTGQETPFRDRWGGWYVTGFKDSPGHLGNGVLSNGARPEAFDRTAHASMSDLQTLLDTSGYLSGSSNVVAHLVLAHQTQMHNLITQTNYQTRLAQYAESQGKITPDATRKQVEKPAEQLVRYLLFANEAPIEGRIDRISDFAREFAARGPRDSYGRSLRDFDLEKRIFKYPCSYLIYSEAFDAIPEPAKSFVYRRLFEILSGQDQTPDFAALSADDRRAILEILAATKPGLPAEWTTLVSQPRVGAGIVRPSTTISKGNEPHDKSH
jgi:hypothetical protein